MRKALTLIVAATLLVTCTACSNDGEDGEPKSQCTGIGNGIYVCEVPRPNGETVECMKVVNGGMSCDWND